MGDYPAKLTGAIADLELEEITGLVQGGLDAGETATDLLGGMCAGGVIAYSLGNAVYPQKLLGRGNGTLWTVALDPRGTVLECARIASGVSRPSKVDSLKKPEA